MCVSVDRRTCEGTECSSLVAQHARLWTEAQVLLWLQSIVGLGEYQPTFSAHQIDGEALLSLTPAELRSELGIISLGHRKRLERAIDQLRLHALSQPTASSSPPSPPSRTQLKAAAPDPPPSTVFDASLDRKKPASHHSDDSGLLSIAIDMPNVDSSTAFASSASAASAAGPKQALAEALQQWISVAPGASPYDTDRCTIERRAARDVTAHEFRTRYHMQRPVILTFEPSERPASVSVREAWAKARLLQDFGEAPVILGTTDSLVQYGKGTRRVSLRQYIEDMALRHVSSSLASAAAASAASSSTHYLFDRSDFYRTHPHLFSAYERLPLFEAAPFSEEQDAGLRWERSMTFAVGADGSGLPFHLHKAGWNEVVYGRKRWLMYPPDALIPFGWSEYRPTAQWFHDNYHRLTPQQMPIECVQRANEVMYIPESWHHATINIGETVAVAGQSVGTSPGSALHHMLAGLDIAESVQPVQSQTSPASASLAVDLSLHWRALDEFEACLKAAPHLPNAHKFKAQSLLALGLVDDAVSALQRSIASNPLYASAWTLLGRIERQRNSLESSRTALLTAHRLAPDEPEINQLLGQFVSVVV
jgi:hypothetical protein